jgi:hypothetical protein
MIFHNARLSLLERSFTAMHSCPRPRFGRLLAITLAAVLPAACANPPPPSSANPFLGAWATPERSQITFRDNTIVMSPPNQTPTALDPAACAGRFRFGYTRKSREAIAAAIARQPDLRTKLSGLLTQSEYPVAELGCDRGENTYVLLNDRDLIAIYRDGDVAGLERLSRL